eukprot:3465978-Pleurochrysis_carterae.AAC.1
MPSPRFTERSRACARSLRTSRKRWTTWLLCGACCPSRRMRIRSFKQRRPTSKRGARRSAS